MKKRLKPLIPPDKKRCQAMKREGSFMTLGPRPPAERCTNVPTVIAKENKHNEDGRRGSMSLCDECLKELVRRTGKNYATATPIKAKGHRSMNKKCISPFLYEVEYLDTRRNKRVTCVAIHTAERRSHDRH